MAIQPGDYVSCTANGKRVVGLVVAHVSSTWIIVYHDTVLNSNGKFVAEYIERIALISSESALSPLGFSTLDGLAASSLAAMRKPEPALLPNNS